MDPSDDWPPDDEYSGGGDGLIDTFTAVDGWEWLILFVLVFAAVLWWERRQRRQREAAQLREDITKLERVISALERRTAVIVDADQLVVEGYLLDNARSKQRAAKDRLSDLVASSSSWDDRHRGPDNDYGSDAGGGW